MSIESTRERRRGSRQICIERSARHSARKAWDSGRSTVSKIFYLLQCLSAQFAAGRYRCPNCGGTSSRIVDRKFVITQLRRCEACQLLFRTPTDRPESNEAYYENEGVPLATLIFLPAS